MRSGGLAMALTKIRLGDFIQRSTINNHDLKYGADLISGVNTEGIFTSPKGNPLNVDLKPYKIVHNGAFVYNPTRLNLGSIAYRTDGLCIVSHLYMVFYLNDEGKKLINPKWLYMYFRRKEFSREVTFRNFGSQRPEFNFNDLSDLVIPIPPLAIQQKYVDVYQAMLANQQSYEQGLEDLNMACEALLEKYKRSVPRTSLGNLISEVDVRNDSGKIESVQGVNKDKQFIPSVTSSSNILKYKIVSTGQFAVNLMHVGRDVAIPVAMNSGKPIIVSPAYTVFEVKDKEILPEFVLMWLSRAETNRFAWFMSDTNVRSGMEKTRFYEIGIPMPTLMQQQSLIEIFQAMDLRKHINERLEERIKNICPILIKGSLDEGRA